MIEIQEPQLHIFRILLACGMLGIGTFFDIRKRQVSDWLWICFGGMAILLVFLETDIVRYLWNTLFAVIVIPIVILLWRFGFFGGADVFAVGLLSVIAPLDTLSENSITPFTTITNAALFSLANVLINFARNLTLILQKKPVFEGYEESKRRKCIAMFLGYHTENPMHCFLMEKTVSNHKKFDFSLKHADRTEFCSEKSVWVTQGMPFILYIFAGFIFQVLLGDILLNLIQ